MKDRRYLAKAVTIENVETRETKIFTTARESDYYVRNELGFSTDELKRLKREPEVKGYRRTKSLRSIFLPW